MYLIKLLIYLIVVSEMSQIHEYILFKSYFLIQWSHINTFCIFSHHAHVLIDCIIVEGDWVVIRILDYKFTPFTYFPFSFFIILFLIHDITTKQLFTPLPIAYLVMHSFLTQHIYISLGKTFALPIKVYVDRKKSS